MILAGDIGGTKTVLGLFDVREEKLVPVRQMRFSSRDTAYFSQLIDAFLQQVGDVDIDAAVFGIAGPVIAGECRATNLPWTVREKTLVQQLGTSNVKLLNDLEATAYGMLYLPADRFVSLNPDAEMIAGNRCVIAAGTGLGEAILYFDGKQFHPIATEGGHTDFAPNTPQQERLLKWLRSQYPRHVSVERVLSGPGLLTLYQFLRESGFAPEPEFMVQLPEDADASAMIAEGALRYRDPLCSESLRLFTEIYGAEAGNLALKTLSVGGVLIGGGIAPKILPYLQKPDFMKAFLDKGRFETLLRRMEVKVSLDPQTALEGAAYYARNRFFERV